MIEETYQINKLSPLTIIAKGGPPRALKPYIHNIKTFMAI